MLAKTKKHIAVYEGIYINGKAGFSVGVSEGCRLL